MDDSLPVVPFLEIISFVFLVSGMKFGQEDHFIHQLSLFETLIHKQIIFLMHSSVTALACSLENLESSPQTIEHVDYNG